MSELIETKYGKISQDLNEFMWDYRYRPTTLDECILPAADKATMKGIVEKGRIDCMSLISDSPGTGKTTLAVVLALMVNAEYILVNGSDCKVDYIRDVLTPFASSKTMKPGGKMIIIDEFDRAGLAEAQKHMRSFIDAYSKNCSVMITANNINGIHPALLSRCPVVKFGTATKEDRRAMEVDVIKRCVGILEIEKIPCDDNKILAALVKKHFPDIRSVVKGLGTYANRGKIDAGILTEIRGNDLGNVIELLKTKNLKEIRVEVIRYASEYENFINSLLEKIYPMVSSESKVALIQMIGENNAQYALAANKEIHLQYLMLNLMMNLSWE
ncbi:clamp-loader subunit [Pectobacterium phage POP12]|nr:clamp-loader subunit [Pectobacterium phage POP12]